MINLPGLLTLWWFPNEYDDEKKMLTGLEDAQETNEVFMTFEYYSLHAIASDVYLMLILYPSGLHNHFLR